MRWSDQSIEGIRDTLYINIIHEYKREKKKRTRNDREHERKKESKKVRERDQKKKTQNTAKNIQTCRVVLCSFARATTHFFFICAHSFHFSFCSFSSSICCAYTRHWCCVDIYVSDARIIVRIRT